MQLDHDYLMVPDALVRELADSSAASPVALAVYLLVARLWLVEQCPVALSRSDLMRYDPVLCDGAAARALRRLVRGGWLERAPGRKGRYTPTWGRSRSGALWLWQIGARYLGRPSHLCTHRVDRRILDFCVGTLSPSELAAARIERYVAQPLLTLADVGIYILGACGHPVTDVAIELLGLASAGQVRPLPGRAAFLAGLTQRSFLDPAVELSDRGMAALGLSVAPAPAAAAEGKTLLLLDIDVARPLIGSLVGAQVGPLIGSARAGDTASEPSRRPGDATGSTREAAPGRSRHLQQNELPPPAEAESALLLEEIGVWPANVKRLGHIDAEQIREVISYVERWPELGSLAAGVVSVLDQVADGWHMPPSATQAADPIDTAAYTSGDAWNGLFRSGSDTSGFDLAGGPPADDQGHGKDSRQIDHTRIPLLPMPYVDDACDDDQVVEELSAPALVERVCGRVRMMLRPAERRVLDRLQLEVGDGETIVRCVRADLDVVQDALWGALRSALADLGAPSTLRVQIRAESARPAPGAHAAASG